MKSYFEPWRPCSSHKRIRDDSPDEAGGASTSKKVHSGAEAAATEIIPGKPLCRRSVFFVMGTFIETDGKPLESYGNDHHFLFLKEHYRDELFKGVMVALGQDVKLIQPYRSSVFLVHANEEKTVDRRNEIYIRDPLIFLELKEKTLAVSSQFYMNDSHPIREEVKYVLNLPEMESVVLDERLDGSNTIFSPSRKVLIHGDCLGTFYPVRDRRYHLTTRELENKLDKYDIMVIGVNSNPSFNWNSFNEEIFHLDDFMHLLPDDRLLILNKRMITPWSYQKLYRVWKDKLVDLQYSMRRISNLPPMNLLSFLKDNNIIIVTNNLELPLLNSLEHFGKVVTVNTLDSRKDGYDQDLSQGVADYLKIHGYVDVKASTLLQKLPLRSDYLASRDEGYVRVNHTCFHEIREFAGKLDSALGEFNLDFLIIGGPHALTQEVVISR